MIVLFSYLPMYGIQIAFKNFRPVKGIWGSEWVDMKWFNRFFCQRAVRLAAVPYAGAEPVIPADVLPAADSAGASVQPFPQPTNQKTLQTVSYAPHFISTVVNGGHADAVLSPTSGLYGNICRLFGMKPGNPMGTASLFRPIYVWSDVWQHTGWDSIIYIAALSSIDPQLYDAATVDGANRYQKILHVEIPALLPAAQTESNVVVLHIALTAMKEFP